MTSIDMIVRLGRRLRLLVAATMAFLVAGALALFLMGVFSPGTLRDVLMEHATAGRPVTLSAGALAGATVLGAAGLSLLLLALKSLWDMFSEFERRAPLSRSAAGHLRQAGLLFLAFAIWRLVSVPVASLVLSVGNTPGERFVAVSIGSADLLAVLTGGVLVIVGHVMALAAEIDEDNRQIV
ncbi:DUF2975 domain-containing protein [Jiella marina]|uniref:DUF2975 domain-containing protein n=1 Tax=Jiella sp. LLJ827 TaxID=2917712 RepID=UPI002100F79A|nr:DUF2975 domain-containing protein [Jiella sp. LLJ827]MCQ0989231.1 DUF2975 domain-containing protein [Jiella sp. LLJ827]